MLDVLELSWFPLQSVHSFPGPVLSWPEKHGGLAYLHADRERLLGFSLPSEPAREERLQHCDAFQLLLKSMPTCPSDHHGSLCNWPCDLYSSKTQLCSKCLNVWSSRIAPSTMTWA